MTSSITNFGDVQGYYESLVDKGLEKRQEGIALIDEEIARTKELIGAKTKSGEIDVVGEIVFKEGDQKIMEGVLMVFKGGKWIKNVIPTPPGGDKDKDKDKDKEAEKRRDEAYEEMKQEIQMKIAYMDEEGALYTTYLMTRKDKDTTYSNWKKEYNQAQHDAVVKAAADEIQNEINKLQAKKNLLKLSHEETMELEMMIAQASKDFALLSEEDKLLALQAIRDEYNNAETEAEKAKLQKKLQANIDNVNKINANLQHGFDIFTNLKRMELAKLDDVNQRKGESDEAYAKRMAIVEEEKKRIAKKYALVEIAAAGSTIVAKTAEGIMKSIAASPQTGGLPWSAIIGAAGAVELAAVIAEKSKVNQYAKGKYNVLGADDGKPYNANYVENLTTGYWPDPTLSLISEKGGEMIIDHQTVGNINQYDPAIWDAVNFYRAPQYATGKNMPEASASGSLPKNITIKMEFPKYIKAVADQEFAYDLSEMQTEIKTIEINAQ